MQRRWFCRLKALAVKPEKQIHPWSPVVNGEKQITRVISFVVAKTFCCPCVCSGVHRNQEEASDTLELELEAFLKLLIWVVGTESFSPLLEQ